MGAALVSLGGHSPRVLAQSVVAAPIDPVVTQVNQTGTTYDITGGTQSGSNLFHSFQQFGLRQLPNGQVEVANFIVNPQIQNILTRVTGGNPSIINGLIQVTGGTSNLYLMNPAGIVFGSGASLNVTASFTATTANGIGFGNNWFSAAGDNNYAALVGNPDKFAFTMSQPGAIVNAGNLSVVRTFPQVNSITLIGGTVISTGQLSASDGNITIVTTPGQSLVTLTSTGSLLSLEIQPLLTTSSQPRSWSFPIVTLPQLLTGGNLENASGLTVDSDGTVKLTGSIQPPIKTGEVVISGILSVSNKPKATDPFGNTTASENTGFIRGGSINILGASISISDGRADSYDRNLSFQSANITNGGNIKITANNGSITTRDLYTRPCISLNTIDQEDKFQEKKTKSSFTKRSSLIPFQHLPFLLGQSPVPCLGSGGSVNLTASGSIKTGNIYSYSNLGDGGSIQLSAITTITAGMIDSSSKLSGNGGDVTIDPQGDVVIKTIDSSADFGRGGNIRISTDKFFRVTESFIFLPGLRTSIVAAGSEKGGDISIVHGGGNRLTPFTVGSSLINSDNSNGTEGSLVTGIINPNNIGDRSNLNVISLGSFPNTYKQNSLFGNIEIITSEASSPQIDSVPQLEQALLRPPEKSPLAQLEQANPPSCFGLVCEVESSFTREYTNALGLSVVPIISLAQAQSALREVERRTDSKVKPAIIYAFFTRTGIAPQDISKLLSSETSAAQSASQRVGQNSTLRVDQTTAEVPFPQEIGCQISENPDDEADKPEKVDEIKQREERLKSICNLTLLLVTSKTPPILRRVPDSAQAKVRAQANSFSTIVASGQDADGEGRQFYQWLIEPLESELRRQGINNLVFVMDKGLRTLPLAAIRRKANSLDDRCFSKNTCYLIEDYSVGLIPSMSLTDTTYANIKTLPALTMGRSTFLEKDKLGDLPFVPSELAFIQALYSSGKPFLDEDFTKQNLEQQRQNFGIIHLATHAVFRRGKAENAAIYLWGDERLSLKDIRQFNWTKPPVELLVLSACQTALGDDAVELGFAGLAVQTRAKTALASLWKANDKGTVVLMTEFHRQLKGPTALIRAEAIRQAQLSLIQGTWKQNFATSSSSFLPANEPKDQFSSPSYWAGFTLIGNPW